jgi:uncharacterized protein YigA (DUF484 family)
MANQQEHNRLLQEAAAVMSYFSRRNEVLHEQVSDLKEELRQERDLCDRLARELDKYGWGDFHYGHTPQNSAVVALVEEHKRRRNNGRS